ncbi:MAG: EamA family transporter [Acidimicrobiales bacterium]
MLAVVLAALSGLSYGAADFSGAFASKDNDATVVTVWMQVVSLLALLLALLVMRPSTSSSDLAWGALGGLGAALGLTTFYKALALGPMSVAASITALVSAAIPVLTGFALGDRPSAITIAGIALAIPAAVLVSVGGIGAKGTSILLPPREQFVARSSANQTRVLAIIAGLGFGLFFIALSRTSGDTGLFPLLGARIASIAALSVVLTASRSWSGVNRKAWPVVVVAGLLDFGANSFYLLALDSGSFTWVAAISSLYPVSTVLLARIVLNERIAALQIVGLALAGGALALVAVGAT